MTPSEAYLHKLFINLQNKLKEYDIHIEFTPNTQFLITHEEFRKQFPKPPVMETFYRWMRKKFNILMDQDKPLGGKWNFDKENRSFDRTYTTRNNGALQYPVSRKQALELLDIFISQHIHRFGELEDAMYTQDHYVYHSLLSSSINF
jgi:deoxyribodipyrimidine photolyase-related protein